ncbi:MAG: UbiA family prenyltransferase [candidate division WOR-3 bacterium]
MLTREEMLKRYAEILRENNTITITTKDKNGKVWSAKTYLGDEDGYIYVILEDKGHTLNNIKENPEVYFVIEKGSPDRFIQGYGRAEIIGPTSKYDRERTIVVRKNFPIIPFLKAVPETTVVRIVPTKVFVSDFSKGWIPRFEIEFNEDDFKKLKEIYPKTPKWKLYIQATRPWVIYATVAAVIVGTLLSGKFDPLRFILTLIGAVSVHLAVNASADYFDYKKGADRWDTLGSSRVIVDNLLKPSEVLAVSLVLYAVALLSGLTLWYLLGFDRVLLYLILFGFVLGFFYAFIPVGWKYLALGDVAVFLAWSLISTGAYYIQTQALDAKAFLGYMPVSLLIVGILHGNNMRDIYDDKRAGYKTLAGIMGPKVSRYYYAFLILSAYILVPIMIAFGIWPLWSLAVYLTLPQALRNISWAFKPNFIQHGMLDFYTAQLQTVFSNVLILSLILSILDKVL